MISCSATFQMNLNETEVHKGGFGAARKDAAFADEEELRSQTLHSLGQQRGKIENRVGQTHIETAFESVGCAVESCGFSKGMLGFIKI